MSSYQRYLFLGLVIGIFGCTPSPRSSVDGYVPEEASLALKTSPLGTLPVGLAGAIGRFPGGAGLFEMVKGMWGVDVSSQESLLKIGLEPEQGLHFFLHDGLPFVLLALRDEDDALDWLKLRAKTVPGSIGSYQGKTGGSFQDYRLYHGEAVTGSRCGIRDRVMVCTHGPRPGELGEALGLILSRTDGSPSFWSAGDNRSLRPLKEGTFQGIIVNVGAASSSYRIMVDQASSAVLGGLGPLRFMLGAIPAFMKELSESTLHFEIGGDKLDFQWTQPLAKEQRESLGELFLTGKSQDYTHWLPRDTPLSFSMRLNLETLLSGLQGLLALIPEGALDNIHPVLKGVRLKEQVLEHLTGDVVVSVLGFDRQVILNGMAVDQLKKGLVEGVEFTVDLKLRDEKAFWEAWDGHTLQTKRYEWLEIPAMGVGGKAGGRIRPKGGKGLNIAIAPIDDRVVLLAGRASYPMVKGVLEGSATSLNRRIGSESARNVFKAGTSVASFYSSFWGISRALEEKGLPRFGVSLMSSFYEAWGAVMLEDKALEMHMEVLF